MSDLLKVGPIFGGTGTLTPFTANLSGAQRAANAHAQFMDATLAGRVYSFGLSNTALAAANAIATGVTSSAQPVIGLWNPSTSGVNLVIWQAIITHTTIANTAVSPAGFMWLVNSAQNAISTGSTPFNTKTLVQGGSVAKAFAMATALTGMSGSLAVLRPAAIGTINAAGPATAIHQAVTPNIEFVEGSLIVPPGGVLAIMGQASTTTVSLNVGIVWEEVPNLV